MALAIPDPVVLGLPCGGVPVAAPVARRLAAPLDVVVVRKLGTPQHRELAMGALGERGVLVVNEAVVRQERVDCEAFRAVQEAEEAELERRVRQLRGGVPPVDLRGRTAVVVDDGVATGATARAACRVVRAVAGRVVLAVPVAAADALKGLVDAADQVACLHAPESFSAVSQSYRDFRPVDDLEVRRLLDAARRWPHG